MLFMNTVTEKMLEIYYKLKENNLFKDFILAGGTALALQIGHRTSTDLDLFSFKKYDIGK